MSNGAMLMTTVAALVAMLWLTQRWQRGKGGPITLALAWLLRRVGRWFWAVGEAVEVGYYQGRKVRDSIRLELETVSNS